MAVFLHKPCQAHSHWFSCWFFHFHSYDLELSLTNALVFLPANQNSAYSCSKTSVSFIFLGHFPTLFFSNQWHFVCMVKCVSHQGASSAGIARFAVSNRQTVKVLSMRYVQLRKKSQKKQYVYNCLVFWKGRKCTNPSPLGHDAMPRRSCQKFFSVTTNYTCFNWLLPCNPRCFSQALLHLLDCETRLLPVYEYIITRKRTWVTIFTPLSNSITC